MTRIRTHPPTNIRSHNIQIKRSHSFKKSEAKQKVETVVRQIADSLGINYHWSGDKLVFGRLGVNGHINVDDNEINVVVRKSPLLPVSDSAIRDQIESHLDKYFN